MGFLGSNCELVVGMRIALSFVSIVKWSFIREMATKEVMIVNIEEKHSGALRSILEGTNYETHPVDSLSDAMIHLQKTSCGALIIDLDNAFLDNRLLKELREKHPGLCIIGLSSRSFHPELEEALSQHIDACFTKSAGYEGLLYWLKAMCDPMIYKEKRIHDSGDEPRERS